MKTVIVLVVGVFVGAISPLSLESGYKRVKVAKMALISLPDNLSFDSDYAIFR